MEQFTIPVTDELIERIEKDRGEIHVSKSRHLINYVYFSFNLPIPVMTDEEKKGEHSLYMSEVHERTCIRLRKMLDYCMQEKDALHKHLKRIDQDIEVYEQFISMNLSKK
jgi:hypothetical protein